MGTPPLSSETERRIALLFAPADHETVRTILLEECGYNLPGCAGSGDMERIRFGALKLSRGKLDKLRAAVELAKIDWRDVLLSARFAWRVDAHKEWLPGKPSRFSPKRWFAWLVK